MKGSISIIAGLMMTSVVSAQTSDPFSPPSGPEPTRPHDPFDPDLSAPKMVQIQVEYIQVSQTRYLDLVSEKKASADATAMRTKLQKMASAGQATVLETGMVVARSGEKATIESIQEFIFPTEYNPPGSEAFELTEEQKTRLRNRRMLRIPITPPSFETRNLGNTFEVAPVLGSQGQIVDLQFAPELVTPAGFSVYHEEENFDGQVHQDRMPYFIKNSINTAITCVDGQYNLVGLITPADEQGQLDPSQKVMMFIKCDIVLVKEAPAEK